MKKENIVTYAMDNEFDESVQVSFHINFSAFSRRHYHEYWEIQVMLENECINVLDGEMYPLSEMEMQIIRPDALHYCKKTKSTEHKLLNIEIKKPFFERLLREFSSSFANYVLENKTTIPKIKCSFSVFERIWKLVQMATRYHSVASEKRQYLSKEILMMVLFEFMQAYYLEKIEGEKDCYESFYPRLMDLMLRPENLSLKLHEVCAMLPCSVESAIRNFKKEGKETPNKIFRRLKMEYACSLLETTDNTVMYICETVGYNNLGFFNKIFRETYGLSPTEYRRESRRPKGNKEAHGKA